MFPQIFSIDGPSVALHFFEAPKSENPLVARFYINKKYFRTFSHKIYEDWWME